MRREERKGGGNIDGLTGRRELDRNRHKPAIQRNVEQFLAVVAPTYLSSAVRRDLPLLTWPGERLDVNLKTARLIGLVRDPFSVRRELPVSFNEVCSDNR